MYLKLAGSLSRHSIAAASNGNLWQDEGIGVGIC